jgi:hypothetical protein
MPDLSINLEVSGPEGFQATASFSGNLSDEAKMKNVQTVGTSSEALVKGDIASPGYLFCQNLDPTNFVDFSTDNANADIFATLAPGDFFLIKAHSTTVYAKADTNPCRVSVLFFGPNV